MRTQINNNVINLQYLTMLTTCIQKKISVHSHVADYTKLYKSLDGRRKLLNEVFAPPGTYS